MANLIAMGVPKTEIAEMYKIGRTSIFRYLKECGYASDGRLANQNMKKELK